MQRITFPAELNKFGHSPSTLILSDGFPFGQRNGNHGAVVPEALETIEHSFLFVENVSDDVTKIEQDPSTQVTAFPSERAASARQHLIFDFVGDRLNVSFIASSDHDKRVDDSDGSAHIESDNVFSLLGVRCGGDDGDMVYSGLGCGH
jgi:hypothetical protein